MGHRQAVLDRHSSSTCTTMCIACRRERERERRAHDASVYLPTRVNRSAMRLDLIRMSIGASLQRSGGHTQHANHRMHTNINANTDEHAWH